MLSTLKKLEAAICFFGLKFISAVLEVDQGNVV